MTCKLIHQIGGLHDMSFICDVLLWKHTWVSHVTIDTFIKSTKSNFRNPNTSRDVLKKLWLILNLRWNNAIEMGFGGKFRYVSKLVLSDMNYVTMTVCHIYILFLTSTDEKGNFF